MLAPPRALHHVTLVVAGEGFGKNEFVAQRVLETSGAVAHFYPRSDQRALLDLTHGLVQALCGIAPDLTTSFAGAGEYARQCAEPEDELGMWMLRHLQGAQATIVLHDLDAVADPAFFGLIQHLIEGSDAALQWVCTARSDPPLPWETWRAYGLLGEVITEADLRLERTDALALADRYECGSDAALRLLDATGAWPLGFKIALRAGQPQPGATYEDLAERIFAHFHEPLKELLVQCSVLTEFDPAFAAALGQAGQWSRIAELADEGLLLVHKPYGAVRYRDAFRALLERTLADRGEAALRDARVNAARGYERSGRNVVALRLYSAWDCPQDVLRICEEQGFELIEMGHVGALNRALEIVDEKTVQTSAVALTVKAMEESRVGRHDIAEAWFLQAIATAKARETKASIAYRYALDLIRNGRIDGVKHIEPFAEDWDLVPELRASIRTTLAVSLVMSGRFEEAKGAIEQALAVTREYPDKNVAAKTLHHAAWVALFTGDIETAREIAVRAVDVALDCSMYECAARAYSVLYNIAYDVEDDPAETQRLLERILDCGVKAGSAPVRLFALLGMYDLA
ncbi:MAG: tetratricopeptide repeat protein, partial [Candidatus Baltobacteraceae bacterium]